MFSSRLKRVVLLNSSSNSYYFFKKLLDLSLSLYIGYYEIRKYLEKICFEAIERVKYSQREKERCSQEKAILDGMVFLVW